MSITAITPERNITNALISGLANMSDTPTREQVEQKAKQLAEIFGYTGDLQNIVIEAMVSVDTRMGTGISLVDVTAKHDDKWTDKRENISWIYAKAYEEFLRNEGWPPQMVQSLSDVTARILGHLQDPLSEGTTWSRRGLVIGHVQSGKTANYTGLLTRAADAGYKFIIVIAGIHNNLRKQTQQRIDEAFIGRSSDPEDRRSIGVGLTSGYPYPATLTNINEDFNKNTAAKSGWRLNDFSKPIILVIKKNVATLNSLHRWLKELNSEADGRISVPMLLIDDEADNASINTNKEDLDPTRTNAMIRRILGLFAKSCYVGYTATPFANIFINPDDYDDDVREELFPRDFIYCLDAPTTYFGPEKVFLNDETSQAIVRSIDDCKDFIPYTHKRDDDISELPPSLYRALDQFIMARAIRNLRGQVGKHCSMMVNVSRFVPVQKAVRDLLSLRATKIKEAVRANYALPEDVSARNAYMQGLRQAFNTEFADIAKCSWDEAKANLNRVFDHLHIYVINSKSDEILDYARYEKDGIGLTAIAVGGLSLSRGLTIEGLTVSYMYRNTKMYDTLMQMGRWFGYRPGFEDLCRVHLSRDSINWYSHIADAAEELVQQVKRMRRDLLSPKDFGLYVRSHPDSLLITATNKMRTGQEVTVEQSFSGRLRESYTVSTDPDVNTRNFTLISNHWKNGFGGKPAEATRKGIIFRDVSVEVIDDFLTNFECHSTFAGPKADVLGYLDLIAAKRPLADVLLISPDGGPGGGSFTLKNQIRAVGKDQPNGTSWRLNKDRVASRGDEKLGLSDAQCDEAESLAGDGGAKAASDTHFRMVRNKPLLMLHSLLPKDVSITTGSIAAFGISFPYGDYSTTINVVVNKVWLQQMQGYVDDPNDEEDYDD